jgi:hypothetical protein
MVKVVSCLERQRKDGSSFVVLEISGGVELVLSQKSQRYYATLRRVFIPFTGTLENAKLFIGQELEGEVVRLIVPKYEYLNKTTGEVMILQHAYAYSPKDSRELVGHTRVDEMMPA